MFTEPKVRCAEQIARSYGRAADPGEHDPASGARIDGSIETVYIGTGIGDRRNYFAQC
jgi:hypothetical protein